jgi:ubiquinone/menaquinone biosynthesis C-methylase UbiE
MARFKPGHRVLDAGCGVGSTAIEMDGVAYNSATELNGIVPDFTVTTLSQLLPVLDELQSGPTPVGEQRSGNTWR